METESNEDLTTKSDFWSKYSKIQSTISHGVKVCLASLGVEKPRKDIALEQLLDEYDLKKFVSMWSVENAGKRDRQRSHSHIPSLPFGLTTESPYVKFEFKDGYTLELSEAGSSIYNNGYSESSRVFLRLLDYRMSVSKGNSSDGYVLLETMQFKPYENMGKSACNTDKVSNVAPPTSDVGSVKVTEKNAGLKLLVEKLSKASSFVYSARYAGITDVGSTASGLVTVANYIANAEYAKQIFKDGKHMGDTWGSSGK